ncbi:hypothetical protein F4776DRAFT_102578 [Hypoxylon sp. NC0597]|nr:hypothetical protein F4776DRAFT_102578 [Hypoxylon sp. NC0597]
MAEFDDIEYEGIGGDRHISVGSDRCFRDYSPGNTVISLSDDGQALYSCRIPSFPDPLQSHSGLGSSTSQPQSRRCFRSATGGDLSSATSPLNRGALTVIQQRPPSCFEAEPSPLTRYRRDEQTHEKVALGIKSGDFKLPPCPESPTPRPRENGHGRPSTISSLHLSSCPNPTPSTGPGTSSAAEQLREVLDVIESPEWEDGMSPEEQAEHLRRATKLKRRVRSETNPREARPPKVRKRDRLHLHDSKAKHSPSP